MRKQISQSQIQSFQECHWQYFLAHVQKLAWPTPVTPAFQKNAENLRLGKAFHLYVHRTIQGILPTVHTAPEPAIAKWIENFIAFNPLPENAVIYSEKEVTMLSDDFIWLGEFDALAIQENQLTIFDWKTSAKPGNEKTLRASPQTRLYLYLLFENRFRFAANKELMAENLEILYWYPNFPTAPVRIQYSHEQALADEAYLRHTANSMRSDKPEDYPQTTDENKCARCRFQTFCHRGTDLQDVDTDEMDSDWFFSGPDEEIDPEI